MFVVGGRLFSRVRIFRFTADGCSLVVIKGYPLFVIPLQLVCEFMVVKGPVSRML
jgi:hypothetical protein